MTAPVQHQTHEGVTEPGASEIHGSKGHTAISLFVSAFEIDPSSDSLTVVVEASPNGERWTILTRSDGSQVRLTASDLDSDGDGYAPVNGAITSRLRVRITEHSGGFNVDTWLATGGWEGPSHNV